MKKTLVILAAGIGSRFGEGIKQLTPVGPNGEIIIDYSIHDAIAAGFNKIIFIIRHDIENEFKEAIGNRIEKVCKDLDVEVEYAFQDLKNVPIEVPEGRTKPWGTGHAVLACDGMLHEPFAVINADDYYGTEGFKKASKFLETNSYGMVAYILKNTLSDNGGVTRGICRTNAKGELTGIDETHDIVKTKNGGAESEGVSININSLVSMNFWCFKDEYMEVLKKKFPVFLKNMKNPVKDEYLLPIIMDELIKEGNSVAVLPTEDKWFGVTYKEDKESVIESFKEIYAKGIYKENNLYSDLK